MFRRRLSSGIGWGYFGIRINGVVRARFRVALGQFGCAAPCYLGRRAAGLGLCGGELESEKERQREREKEREAPAAVVRFLLAVFLLLWLFFNVRLGVCFSSC